MEKNLRKSVYDELHKYDYLAKENDYIEVTSWQNGEGFTVDLNNEILFNLTWGQFNALKYLGDTLDLSKKDEFESI